MYHRQYFSQCGGASYEECEYFLHHRRRYWDTHLRGFCPHRNIMEVNRDFICAAHCNKPSTLNSFGRSHFPAEGLSLRKQVAACRVATANRAVAVESSKCNSSFFFSLYAASNTNPIPSPLVVGGGGRYFSNKWENMVHVIQVNHSGTELYSQYCPIFAWFLFAGWQMFSSVEFRTCRLTHELVGDSSWQRVLHRAADKIETCHKQT